MVAVLHCFRQKMLGKNVAEARQILPEDRLRYLELCACCEILAFSAGTSFLAPQMAGVTTL
jgi:hypothetical protein